MEADQFLSLWRVVALRRPELMPIVNRLAGYETITECEAKQLRIVLLAERDEHASRDGHQTIHGRDLAKIVRSVEASVELAKAA